MPFLFMLLNIVGIEEGIHWTDGTIRIIAIIKSLLYF